MFNEEQLRKVGFLILQYTNANQMRVSIHVNLKFYYLLPDVATLLVCKSGVGQIHYDTC